MTVRSGFQYKCLQCDEVHDGFPAVAFDAPNAYHAIPEAERAERAQLTDELCVLDGTHFYVRCVLDFPVKDSDEVLSWGVWGSLSAESFKAYQDYCEAGCEHALGPFFSWLGNKLPAAEYPNVGSVACEMRVSSSSSRPELIIARNEALDLWREQSEGIDFAKALRIVQPYISWHSNSRAPKG